MESRLGNIFIAMPYLSLQIMPLFNSTQKLAMEINEATLEARIHKVLALTFPTFREFKIEHQKYFSIRLGHHEVTVNHEAPPSRPVKAKLDILLKSGEKNIILLELKKEGLSLNDEDRDQGISYARLIHPMPPLVLISNGHDNVFYNTYTKEKVARGDVDMDLVQQMTDSSFEIAMNDFKEAINILLNRQPEIFSKIINKLSEKNFSLMKGSVDDILKPICDAFLLPRQVSLEIYTTFQKGHHLIALIGPAFSGKTNVLYQFYQTYTNADQHYVLYIDCQSVQYSFFQQLANYFSRETKVNVTKDKIREWLNNSFYEDNKSQLYLMLDNFSDKLHADVKSEIYEVLDMISGTKHGIIFTMDEIRFKKLSLVEDRKYATVIGVESKQIHLTFLQEDEYNKAAEIMAENFSLYIQNGGYYASEYRQPRILRQLAAFYSAMKFLPGQGTKIKAVPDFEFLRFFSNNEIYSKSIHSKYKMLATCFLLDDDLRKKFPELKIASSTAGAISENIIKHKFPSDFDGILNSGLTVPKEYPSVAPMLIPKIPELLAFHAVDIIMEEIKEMMNQPANKFEDILAFFIKKTKSLPYSDLVGTGVLVKLSAIDSTLFSEIIASFLEDEPEEDDNSGGAQVMLFDEKHGPITIKIPENTEEAGQIFDPFAYAVLSQLAGYPMELTTESEDNQGTEFNTYLIERIGSWNGFIPRYDHQSFSNLQGFHVHTIEGVGDIICETTGIIEPLVQSIQKYFMKMPHAMEDLINRAFDEKNIHLLWRCYLALLGVSTIIDEELSELANKFITRFKENYGQFICT